MIIEFIGIIENADFSLCNVKLNRGFRFEQIQNNAFMNEIINNLESPGNSQNKNRILSLSNHDDNMFYLVRNSFDEDIIISEISTYFDVKERLGICTAQYCSSTWAGQFLGKLDLAYLHNTFRLMNLFKEGNLTMPLSYYYSAIQGKYILFERGGIFPDLSHRRQKTHYSLSDSERIDLQIFLEQENEVLFSDTGIGLAFNHFESSDQTYSINQSFLSLMTCIEIIFSPGNELKNRVSRGVAILLGNSPEKSREIFSHMKDLYDKRSKLVHSGKKVVEKDLFLLRHYAREALKKLVSNRVGVNLEDFRRQIEFHGLGEKPFTFRNA